MAMLAMRKNEGAWSRLSRKSARRTKVLPTTVAKIRTVNPTHAAGEISELGWLGIAVWVMAVMDDRPPAVLENKLETLYVRTSGGTSNIVYTPLRTTANEQGRNHSHGSLSDLETRGIRQRERDSRAAYVFSIEREEKKPTNLPFFSSPSSRSRVAVELICYAQHRS